MKHYSKTYRVTSYDRLHMSFEIDGELKSVYFGGCNRYQKVRGHYTTADEKIQEALESNPLFGNYFVLEKKELIGEDNVEEKVPAAEKKAEDEAPKFAKMTFKTVKDCQSYLQNEHGMKGYLYSSYAKCKEACKEVGVEATFENEGN